jgi:hypothetical protein
MLTKMSTGFKGISLNWDSFYTPAKVCLVAIFSPSAEGEALPLTLSCPRHQAQIEGFSGQVGEIMVSTQTYHYKSNEPCTLVHFGLGSRVGFDLTAWEVALTAVLGRTRHFNVQRMVMDLDAIGLQTFLDYHAHEFGAVIGSVVQKLLADAPRIEFVDVGIRYQTLEVRQMIQQGLAAGEGAESNVAL